jgi:superfamily I DNA/RNA helicase
VDRSPLPYALKAFDEDPDLELEGEFTHVLANEYQDLNRCESLFCSAWSGSTEASSQRETTIRASVAFGTRFRSALREFA